MKLIIDIDKELAEKEHWYTDKEIWTVVKAVQNGIPLDNVFDKIRAKILNFKEKCNASDYLGCGILEIIDKYRGKQNE